METKLFLNSTKLETHKLNKKEYLHILEAKLFLNFS
jgi:hypothetical protein